MSWIRRFRLSDKLSDKGQDMIEYALLAAFISIIAILTIRFIGNAVGANYADMRAALEGPGDGGGITPHD